MVKTFTLKNGIKVAFYRVPTLKSFYIQALIKGGSIVEDPKESGIAHYMEHMLLQGIPSYPTAEDLSAFVESIAGHYNAYTSRMTVAIPMSVPLPHAETAIKIVSEAFFSPLFPEDSMEKERRAVLNEIKQDMDSPYFKLGEFSRKTRYKKDSQLQLLTAGTPDTVATFSRDDLIAYWKKYFLPKNTYIYVRGDMTQKKLHDFLETYFGQVKNDSPFPGYPDISEKDLEGSTVALRQDTNLQVNYVDFSFQSIRGDDPVVDRVAHRVAMMILGRMHTSRLFRLLRYQKGLVYGVSAGASMWPSLGVGGISSEVTTEHLEEVVRLITQELHIFLQNGPSQEEIDKATNYLKNSWLMVYDNWASVSEWIRDEFLWEKKIQMPEEYSEFLKEITREKVMSVMNRYWKLDKLQLNIQGPVEDSEEMKKKFEKIIEVLKV
jgi:predicted Zn-dependent peptidase